MIYEGIAVRMDYQVGDMIAAKKEHPCGENKWEILRVGMDFRIRCVKCGHMLLLPRTKFEKMVKKLLSGITGLLLLLVCTACQGTLPLNEDEGQAGQEIKPFSLTRELQAQYSKATTALLDQFYWRYDSDSVLFSEAELPAADTGEYALFADASQQAGVDTAPFAGQKAVAAAIALTHFNNDPAGTAHIYFVDDSIAAVYYKTDPDSSRLYGLKSRNVFLSENLFTAFENNDQQQELDEINVTNAIDPLYASARMKNGKVVLASILDHVVTLYRYDDNGKFAKLAQFEEKDGLFPLSVAFVPDDEGFFAELAILYARVSDHTAGEEASELEPIYESTEIAFYDTLFKKKAHAIPLDSINCRFLSYEDGKLVVSESQSLVYYRREAADSWIKESKIYLSHGVTAYARADLTNRGGYEFIMTDGMDLYMYRKSSNNYELLWRTHISMERYAGTLFVGDCNGDGIKEIYIEDETNTTVRYVLTENGFVSFNEDILFGEKLYVCDVNLDGKDDFIKVWNAETNQQRLYVGK